MKDWDDLILFKKKQPGRKETNKVTISCGSSMYFNLGFLKSFQHIIKKNESVIILYSRMKHAIAFKFVDDACKERICLSKNGKSKKVSIKGFVDSNCLNVERINGSYDVIVEEIPNYGQMFIIYLKN